ncbi:hypothetical protein HRbin23_01626 [bacterium HR23]|nr:hypothetical protein HRbin23_01626 [bacterium HR23]
MELAVLPTRVNARGQVGQQALVKLAAREVGGKGLGVHAHQDSPKTQGKELLGHPGSVAPPQGENSLPAHLGQHALPVGTDVFQEEVAEGGGAHPLLGQVLQRLAHGRFVDGVGRLPGNPNGVQGDADGVGLGLEQVVAHPVHAHPLVILSNGGQEAHDMEGGVLKEVIQGKGAVFAPAPDHNDLPRHGSSPGSVGDCPAHGKGARAPVGVAVR